MQLLVLGMHRSGTSMLARLINLMGAYVGPEHVMLSFDHANSKGYWERRDVMEVNDEILRLNGCTWNRVANWSLAQPRALPPEVVHRMQSIVLGMDAFRPWVMKDPRMCLTLPCWIPFLEAPVAVMMHRDPQEIGRSLLSGNKEQRKTPPALSLALWEYHAVGALNATRGMPRVFVRHDRLIAHPVETVSRLFSDLEALGTGMRRMSMPSKREINAFVDPRLNRSQADVLAATLLTTSQQEIDAMLRGERTQDVVLELSASSIEVTAQVEAEEALAQAKAEEALAQAKAEEALAQAKAEEALAQAKAEEALAQAKVDEEVLAQAKAEEALAQAKALEALVQAKVEEALAQAKAEEEEAMAQAKAEEAIRAAQEEAIRAAHPLRTYFGSRIARILSLNNSRSRNP